MDAELKQAACLGDIEFLHRAFATKSTDYFLSYYSSPDGDRDIMGNIFHLAARKLKVEFMREACMRILPDEVVLRLLSQQDEDHWNPLHVATSETDCLESVRLILGFYKSVSLSAQDQHHHLGKAKPWLALNNNKRTPFHIALRATEKTEDDEECALEILSMDNLESFCNIVDDEGNSPLFYAVKNGFSRVAEMILMSSPSSYSLSGENGSTPLHFAPNSSENVLRLLLEKHPELLDNIDDESGYNVVHQWVELHQIWPFEYVIEGGFPDASSKIFTDLINSATEKKTENNPLHIAAKTGKPEIVRVLVQGYQKEIQASCWYQKSEIVSLNCPPWKARNRLGETPLMVAISSDDEEMALYFLSIDSTLCQIYNNRGESPLLCAIGYGRTCGRVVEQILNIQDPLFSDLRSINGTNVLHLVGNCPENIGKRVLEKYWWMMSLLNDQGKNALSCAKELNVQWLVNLLKNPSLIKKEPFDWITACKKNENWAVAAFIDSFQDLQKVCREKQDTPLHHIRFQTYEECLKFLKKSSIAELKNSTDFEGATPLHRALERKDKHMAKALLIDDAVERNC